MLMLVNLDDQLEDLMELRSSRSKGKRSGAPKKSRRSSKRKSSSKKEEDPMAAYDKAMNKLNAKEQGSKKSKRSSKKSSRHMLI